MTTVAASATISIKFAKYDWTISETAGGSIRINDLGRHIAKFHWINRYSAVVNALV